MAEGRTFKDLFVLKKPSEFLQEDKYSDHSRSRSKSPHENSLNDKSAPPKTKPLTEEDKQKKKTVNSFIERNFT